MIKKIRKPRAPKLTASESQWSNYKRKLSEYKKYKSALDARRKLRDS